MMDATTRFKLYAGALAAQICSLEEQVEHLEAENERLRDLLPNDGEAPSPEGATVSG